MNLPPNFSAAAVPAKTPTPAADDTPAPAKSPSLADVEARQDEVLAQLNQLIARLEEVLKAAHSTSPRPTKRTAA